MTSFNISEIPPPHLPPPSPLFHPSSLPHITSPHSTFVTEWSKLLNFPDVPVIYALREKKKTRYQMDVS